MLFIFHTRWGKATAYSQNSLMINETHTYLLADIRKALKARQLLLALQSLRGLSALLKASVEADEVETLCSSYSMLLSYMTQGAEDPQRKDMYRQFIRRAYELSDTLERKAVLADNTSFYRTSLGVLEKMHGVPCEFPRLIKSGCELRDIFDAVWLSGQLTTAEETVLDEYLLDEGGESTGRLLVTSALTLGGMLFFDIAKFRILLDTSLSTDPALRVRAITGILFVHMAHPGRLALYPEVRTRLCLMADSERFKRELEMLQAQLFLSIETKRIEKNLRDEIIPQMMKRMENMRIDRSLGIDELGEKLGEADLNPEWEDDGTPSKLVEYMNEFVELQQRGADMYMTTFKVLKQRFPFFKVAANWFWPFSLRHPEIPDSARKSDTLKVLLHSAGLCDSDKFSFCFMVAGMPNLSTSGANAGIMEKLPYEMRQAIEKNGTQSQPSYKELLRSYVQGFYRFCNLFIHREAFPNPFSNNLFIVDYPPFDTLLEDDDFLLRMADFAFKDKTYALARNLYERVEREKLTAGMSQRLGYCYEQEGQTDKAVDFYELANALKPDSEWTLRRLATCQRLIGNYSESFRAYSELATLRTEDANVSLHQAECLIHLERYEEAFKFLFKADYLAPDSVQTTRALAWCSLLTQKYAQAERYYETILAGTPSPSDWLNAGHTSWLQGKVGEAVTRYRQSVAAAKKSGATDIAENFLATDLPLLRRAGLSEEEIALMSDAVNSESLNT